MLLKTILLVMAGMTACAYGDPPPAPEVYGSKAPETWDGSNPPLPFGPLTGDPADDPYTTGCFQQPIWGPEGEAQPPIGWFWICDGQAFTPQDEIDPPPDDRAQMQRQQQQGH
jgi:hypothetical protein